jgi:hypothetical protein
MSLPTHRFKDRQAHWIPVSGSQYPAVQIGPSGEFIEFMTVVEDFALLRPLKPRDHASLRD